MVAGEDKTELAFITAFSKKMPWPSFLGIVGSLPSFIRQYIIPDMRIPPISNDPSKVQLCRLAHVYFEHPDLKEFEKFAKDFGFVETKRDGNTVYYSGYGKDPYVYVAKKSKDGNPNFGGAAFVAASQEEFVKAAKIPGAKIRDLTEAPGGGKMITFSRPNGTFMHVVFGQEERKVDTQNVPSEIQDSQGPFNRPFEKHRLGQFQRYHEGPALVHKLGHYGYVCKEFEQELDFYTSNFNIVPSDVLYHPQLTEVDVMTFMHLDLGSAYSDHHVLFLQLAPPGTKKSYMHHSSYEVDDFDTQLIGHQWLAKKGWKSIWGVGRHILGSQIFDYWEDSSGFKIEHYADGDLVNSSNETRRDVMGPISIWGPELPKDFGDDKTQLATL